MFVQVSIDYSFLSLTSSSRSWGPQRRAEHPHREESQVGRSKQDEPGGDKENKLSKGFYLSLRCFKFVIQICAAAAVCADFCFSDTQYI